MVFFQFQTLSYPADQMQDGAFSPALSSQKTKDKKSKKDDKNKDKVGQITCNIFPNVVRKTK